MELWSMIGVKQHNTHRSRCRVVFGISMEILHNYKADGNKECFIFFFYFSLLSVQDDCRFNSAVMFKCG